MAAPAPSDPARSLDDSLSKEVEFATVKSPNAAEANDTSSDSHIHPVTSHPISTSEKNNATQPLEQTESAENYPTGIKLVLLLLAVYLSVFLVALDRTIIATALPRITDAFNSFDDVGWYNGAFTMTVCAFQLFFGRVYTFYSPKHIFIALTIVFEIGSAICGAAPNSVAFIWGRAIAGLGASGLFTGANLLLVYAAPLHKRALYTGLFAAVFGVASVAGPLLGGVFTEEVTWRWCFYINLPIGGAIIPFLWLAVPQTVAPKAGLPFKEQIRRLDIPGTCAILPAIVCILLALQWGGQTYAWSNWRIILLLVLFGVLIILFGAIQVWQGESATIPPRLLKQRTILGGVWFAFFLGSTFLIPVYYMSIWFQAIKDDSPLIAGVSQLPLLLGMVISSIGSGVLVMKLGPYKPAMIASGILMPIAAGLFCLLTTSTGHSFWIGIMFFFGFAIGCGMQQPNVAAQTVLPKEDLPSGVALMFFVQLFGPTIWVAVSQNLLDTYLVSQLSGLSGLTAQDIVNTGATDLRTAFSPQDLPKVLTVYNEGIRHVFYLGAALACFAIFGALAVENKSVKKARQQAAAAAKKPDEERPEERIDEKVEEKVESEQDSNKEVSVMPKIPAQSAAEARLDKDEASA